MQKCIELTVTLHVNLDRQTVCRDLMMEAAEYMNQRYEQHSSTCCSACCLMLHLQLLRNQALAPESCNLDQIISASSHWATISEAKSCLRPAIAALCRWRRYCARSALTSEPEGSLKVLQHDHSHPYSKSRFRPTFDSYPKLALSLPMMHEENSLHLQPSNYSLHKDDAKNSQTCARSFAQDQHGAVGSCCHSGY